MADSEQETDVEATPEKEFKPNKSFREMPLKRALRSYVVSTVCKSYLTLGIRVLWKEENFSDMYVRRKELEQIFKNVKEIKMVISCVTAISKKEKTDTGFAFWIVYDRPKITASKFENMLCKRIIKTGVRISCCKGVKGRGKMLLLIYCFDNVIL